MRVSHVTAGPNNPLHRTNAKGRGIKGAVNQCLCKLLQAFVGYCGMPSTEFECVFGVMAYSPPMGCVVEKRRSRDSGVQRLSNAVRVPSVSYFIF